MHEVALKSRACKLYFNRHPGYQKIKDHNVYRFPPTLGVADFTFFCAFWLAFCALASLGAAFLAPVDGYKYVKLINIKRKPRIP